MIGDGDNGFETAARDRSRGEHSGIRNARCVQCVYELISEVENAQGAGPNAKTPRRSIKSFRRGLCLCNWLC